MPVFHRNQPERPDEPGPENPLRPLDARFFSSLTNPSGRTEPAPRTHFGPKIDVQPAPEAMGTYRAPGMFVVDRDGQRMRIIALPSSAPMNDRVPGPIPGNEYLLNDARDRA